MPNTATTSVPPVNIFSFTIGAAGLTLSIPNMPGVYGDLYNKIYHDVHNWIGANITAGVAK